MSASAKTPPTSPHEQWILSLSEHWQADFRAHRRLLGFDEFLELVTQHPTRLARSSAQYLLDALEHFGSSETPRGRRYHAFDVPWDDGEDRVVGHELAQNELQRVLRNFVRERRVNRLVLFHGPNGSAKSSFVGGLMRLLEAYSRTEEGALYRYNWVFPSGRAEGGPIGFGSLRRDEGSGSFAHLEEAQIDVKLPAEQNDNPLFLLPRVERETLLKRLLAPHPEFVLSDTIGRGDLGPRSRAVFDALTQAYRGDFARVLRHVQVERFFISKRYRRGAVTVEPQLHVDAGARQLTVDRSLSALPPVLQSQTLFEPFGPLVEANRGIVEYNDLLKRPMDANKYLLATSEKGTVSLDIGELHVDALLLATANETYLDAFKQTPDWPSYKGRFELIRMPYLLDFTSEQSIYDDLVQRLQLAHAPAPHTTWIVALWSVLTRLRRPDAERFERPTRALIASLTPMQKAYLYAGLEAPGSLTAEQRRDLAQATVQLRRDGGEGAAYEGRSGASAREMKTLLLNALSAPGGLDSVRPLFAELERLVREVSVYDWLRVEAEGEYNRPDRFIATVREHYLDRVEREVRNASGLVAEMEYLRVFERYVSHVNHWLRSEKVSDASTGRSVDPDETMMSDVESRIGLDGTPREFRSRVISRIAAFRIDNPESPVEMSRIFPHFLERLRDDYFGSKRRELGVLCRQILDHFDGNDREQDAGARAQVASTLQRLSADAGFRAEASRAAVALLVGSRYRDDG